MSLHRHALAAGLAAALLPIGDARSEPAGHAASSPSLPVDGVATPAPDYYRLVTYGRRLTEQRATFGMAAVVHPSIAPGTTAWLTRKPSEPLAASYAAPQAARKEVGISYSSDGRMSAYVAEPEHPADAGPVYAAGSDCCAANGTSAPPPARYGKAVEAPGVTSLLGQLKAKGLKLSLDDGWKLTAGARSREYTDSTLNSRVGHITLQRWWGDWTTAFSMQFEKRGGWNLAPSQAFQLGYAFAPRSTLGIAYTMGHELAFFSTQGVVKTEVHSIALQGEHAIDKKWSLRLDAGYYNHGDLPTHRAIRIAFRHDL
jgi:hypothetical protein